MPAAGPTWHEVRGGWLSHPDPHPTICGSISRAGLSGTVLSCTGPPPWEPKMDNPTQSYQNRLLQLLARADLEGLHPHLAAVTLEYRQPLLESNVPVRNVYFPVTGVVSLVNT